MIHLLGDCWARLWPNLFAAVASWVSGIVWARRRLLAEWERREAEHLTRHEETHRLIRGLADQIDQQAGQPTEKAEP